MTDRELLELAAKAAGYPREWKGNIKIEEDHGPRFWNPLINDGDALSLAVKLCMQIECSKGWQRVSAYGHSFHINEAVSESNFDASTAARRAIVRAAAEIGKAMP